MRDFKGMVYPYIIWSFALIVMPMLMIVIYAFTKEGNSVMNVRFTLENFAYFFKDKVFVDVLRRSLMIAVITTVVCILLGYPVAYVIARLKPSSQMLMVLIITLPTWINMLVRTYALRGILDKTGVVNSILGLFGIGPIKLLETPFAVVLGMVYNFVPFMILQVYNSLCKMDYSYIEAANDLGADNVQSFFRVTLPLSLPGVISGIALVFLPAVSSFFIPRLLGGGQYMLIGNVIENQFLITGNWGFGSAISLIMSVIIVLAMYLTRYVDKKVSVKGGND